MTDATSPEVLVMLGYELEKIEEAIALRFTYGDARDDEDGPTQETPTLFLMADEARQLARDLSDIADRISAAGGDEAAAAR
jgi:hypothetical protein